MARRVLCTSTIGDSPMTVTVSATPPILISASILTTPVPETMTSSRFKVANPVSVNVTVYVPGCRLSIRYCPAASVVAVRVFSISTGLDASTVTPGSTALEGSLTAPARATCASAAAGAIHIGMRRTQHRRTIRMDGPPMSWCPRRRRLPPNADYLIQEKRPNQRMNISGGEMTVALSASPVPGTRCSR